MTENLDNILDEVRMYDGVKANPAVQSVSSKKTKAEKPKTKAAMDSETRNFLLKGAAFMALVAGCALFDLIHPILYYPLELVAWSAMCFKYGEWKGKKGC